MLCGRRVQRLELYVVLAKQALVVPKTLQQLSLGKPAAPQSRDERGWHALRAGPDAVGTGEFAIALDFALLTQHARKHPLRLRSSCLLLRWDHRRHGMGWSPYRRNENPRLLGIANADKDVKVERCCGAALEQWVSHVGLLKRPSREALTPPAKLGLFYFPNTAEIHSRNTDLISRVFRI